MVDEQRKNLNTLCDRLEDGTYKQGANVLRNLFDGFCCLGVACDIANPNGWREFGYCHIMYDKIAFAPEVIQKEFGFTQSCDFVFTRNQVDKYGIKTMYTNRKVSLTEINDSGATFKQIAALIRGEILCQPQQTNVET